MLFPATDTTYSKERFGDIAFCIGRLLSGGKEPVKTSPEVIDLEIPDSDVEIVGEGKTEGGELVDVKVLSNQQAEIVDVDSMDSDDVIEVLDVSSEEVVLV